MSIPALAAMAFFIPPFYSAIYSAIRRIICQNILASCRSRRFRCSDNATIEQVQIQFKLITEDVAFCQHRVRPGKGFPVLEHLPDTRTKLVRFTD